MSHARAEAAKNTKTATEIKLASKLQAIKTAQAGGLYGLPAFFIPVCCHAITNSGTR
jgi:hypothetical protein